MKEFPIHSLANLAKSSIGTWQALETAYKFHIEQLLEVFDPHKVQATIPLTASWGHIIW